MINSYFFSGKEWQRSDIRVGGWQRWREPRLLQHGRLRVKHVLYIGRCPYIRRTEHVLFRALCRRIRLHVHRRYSFQSCPRRPHEHHHRYQSGDDVTSFRTTPDSRSINHTYTRVFFFLKCRSFQTLMASAWNHSKERQLRLQWQLASLLWCCKPSMYSLK